MEETETTAPRRAILANYQLPDLPRVAAYLPRNYAATMADDGRSILIEGHDVAGWTLDGYVLPRLASGMMFAQEAPCPECRPAWRCQLHTLP